ncbi:hypothetical protein TSOC_012302 [Tetrabaena socialis]|uniref:Uncharacterized protein n=1 Tax=Tetrabaena socialis TaxID=47790 RepID=A0A2J7ZNC0_9CHLO|nr:hypothetical protein TSOC_012302 [Tetrabaena socialis]|eukprot:PNH01771.1 hypothetical protein TSOC_012302 [Tetrabaena socialis]
MMRPCHLQSRCLAIAGYTTASDVSHSGEDLGRASSVADAASKCNADSNCKGINSEGWLLRVVSQNANLKGNCLYTKIARSGSV